VTGGEVVGEVVKGAVELLHFGPRKLKAKPLNCWKKRMLQLTIPRK